MTTSRDDLLALDDPALTAACEVDCARGSGPGGQKRNKTSSAVRITHRPTGFSVRAEASRSQQDNRRAALKRLRWQFALHLREPPAPLSLRSMNAHLPKEAAQVIDHLAAHAYSLRDTAAALGVTTGALSSWIQSSEDVFVHVNQMRSKHGLKALRDKGK